MGEVDEFDAPPAPLTLFLVLLSAAWTHVLIQTMTWTLPCVRLQPLGVVTVWRPQSGRSAVRAVVARRGRVWAGTGAAVVSVVNSSATPKHVTYQVKYLLLLPVADRKKPDRLLGMPLQTSTWQTQMTDQQPTTQPPHPAERSCVCF